MKFLCLCCYAEVTPGMVYCPNCLITLLNPSDIELDEEVIENGTDRNSRS